jgi:hypothetical protein
MFDAIKAGWREFAAQSPGDRFQQRYRRSRNPDVPRGTVRRVIALTIGTILVMAGLVMLVIPGPGLLVMIVGLGFFAEESLWLARWLDAMELWLRRTWARLRSRH